VIDDDHRRERVSFLGRRLSSCTDVRVFAIAPGCERAFDAAEWRDALVVVERGGIELECLSGRRWRFEQGDIICLVALALRALCNEGHQVAVLSAVSRNPRGAPIRQHPAFGATEPTSPEVRAS
jgi:hypothetical protein